MMSVLLVKGQKADLTKNQPGLNTVIVGMGWQGGSAVEVDFSVFMLAGNGKVTKDEDLIFYGNPSNPNRSISIIDSNKRSYAGIIDHAQVEMKLRDIPSSVERVAFALTLYEGEKRKHNFSMLQNTYIRIVDSATGNVLIQYNLGQAFPVETAIVVGELYRYNGEWKVNCIGSGYSGGLGALCGSFGIEVKDEPASNAPAPAPAPIPAPQPQSQPAPAPSSSGSPIRFEKIELKKRGDVINLQKGTGPIGEIVVNLNWNQKKKSGWFGNSGGVDLDLGCLFELKDGRKSTVQALGEAFGSLNRAPYIALDGDDRTGSVSTGENLRINGHEVAQIKRVLIYAFIYEGVTNWSEADGVVTIKQQGGPEIIVRLDEHNNRKGMCAIAMIRNVGDQTFSIEKLVEYYSGHRELDQAHNWGLRWEAGSK